MGNGLCPECGCLMEETSEEKWVGNFDNILIVEIVYTCPCCEYQETVYED